MNDFKLKRINELAKYENLINNKKEVLELLNNEETKDYFLKKLPQNFNNLREVDFVLENLFNEENAFLPIKLAENSISEQNNEYILNLLVAHYPKINKSQHAYDLVSHGVISIAKKILKEYPEHLNQVHELAKAIFQKNTIDFKSLDSRAEYQKQEFIELLHMVFILFKNRSNFAKINEIVGLVCKNFDLISDDGSMVLYTPAEVFNILKEYISSNFEENFAKIESIIVNQYQERYENKFDGWEWMGGGISQSGNSFSTSERHFVRLVFTPCVLEFYEKLSDKIAAWKVIKDVFITRKEKDVSKSKPDFLNRAVISLILKRYKEFSGKEKEEVFEILKDFIEMKRGIPHKNDLIFQELKSLNMDKEEQWSLIELSLNASWNKNHLPINVFIEKITTELADKGFDPAKTALSKWLKVKEYTEGQGRMFGYNIVDNINKLLNSEGPDSQKEGIKLLEEYVLSDGFRDKLERFDVFHVAAAMGKVLEINTKKGIQILVKADLEEKLTVNQQLLICSGINHISKIDVQVEVFENFLKPLLENFECKVDKIIEKFNHNYAREALVEFGHKLAKAKKFDHALFIARIFINDPDPVLKKESDEDEKLTLHQKMGNGEEIHSITSVRGWVCWLLHEVPVLSGRDYIPEVVDMVEKLANDPNNYIRYQACFPLTQLVINRRTFLPNSDGVWFIDPKLADRIETMALSMLRDPENQKLKGLMNGLSQVIGNIRSLDTQQTLEVLNILKDSPYDEAKEKFIPIFIFYAYFRKGSYEGEKWKFLGEYDDSEAKNILEEVVRGGSAVIRRALVWQFGHLVEESVPDTSDIAKAFKYSEAFGIAEKYMQILANKYEREVYSHIYRFIDDNIEKQYYKNCFSLFISCLNNEKSSLIKEIADGHPIHSSWLPYNYIGEVLVKIGNMKKTEDFLTALKIVAEYPQADFLRHGLLGVVKLLADLPKENEVVGTIFDNLIQKDPEFYDDKQLWLTK